jgi:hypothetical protein
MDKQTAKEIEDLTSMREADSTWNPPKKIGGD